MPRERDLAKATREFVIFACLLFCFILSGELGNVYFGKSGHRTPDRRQTDLALVLVSAM